MNKTNLKNTSKQSINSSNNNNSNSDRIFKCKEINDPKKITFTPLTYVYDKNVGGKKEKIQATQCSSFLKYDNCKIKFATERIILDYHGLVSKEFVEKFLKNTDPDYLKLPIHKGTATTKEQKCSEKAKEEARIAFNTLDIAAQSDKCKNEMLLKDKSTVPENQREYMTYSTSIKKPSAEIPESGSGLDSEVIEKKKQNAEKYKDKDFVKLKFKTHLDEGGKRIYDTIFKLRDLSKKRGEEGYSAIYEVNSYDSLLKLCPRGSSVKFLIEATRCWSPKELKTVRSGTTTIRTREYGITYTILQMEVVRNESQDFSSASSIKDYNFPESDDEEEVEINDDETEPSKNPSNVNSTEKEDDINDEEKEEEEEEEEEEVEEEVEEEEEAEEEEEEEEELPPPPPVKPAAKKVTKAATTSTSRTGKNGK